MFWCSLLPPFFVVISLLLVWISFLSYQKRSCFSLYVSDFFLSFSEYRSLDQANDQFSFSLHNLSYLTHLLSSRTAFELLLLQTCDMSNCNRIYTQQCYESIDLFQNNIPHHFLDFDTYFFLPKIALKKKRSSVNLSNALGIMKMY